MNTFLALGDSYTVGEGVSAAVSWPEQWACMMRARGTPIQTPVRILAQTGWSTDELSQAWDAAGDLGAWDIVSVLIGVNNQYRGRSVENFQQEFEVLLQRALQLANQRLDRVMVLSIPDWGQTPYGLASGRDLMRISQEIDAFNQAKKSVCKQYGVMFHDITEITRAAAANPAMHAEDGLHPSEKMYQLWVRALRPAG